MMDQTMTCDRFTDRLMDYLEHDTDDDTRAAMERHSVTCGECGPLLADLRKLRIDAANMPELAPSRDLWAGIEARIETPVVPIGSATPSAIARPSLRAWGRRGLIAASLVAAAGIGYVARGTPATGAVSPIATIPEDMPQIPDAPLDTAAFPAVPVTSVATTPETEATPTTSAPAPARGSSPSVTPAVTASRPLEVQLAVATLRADYDREIARLRALIEQRRNQLEPTTVAIIERNLAVIDTAILESQRAVAADPSSRFLIEFLNQSLQKKVELMRTVAMLPNRT